MTGGLTGWIAQLPPWLLLAAAAGCLMAAAAMAVLMVRQRRQAMAVVQTLQAENSDLAEQVKRLKHRTQVLARALAKRDDTPNTPDGYVREGLSADFRAGGARPAMVTADSYIHDDEIQERRGSLLAVKPAKRGPPVLPPDLLDDYRKAAVNE
ncbi:MAG: hypothetical protein ACOY99_01705 [Pseudomonadota bacterium]